MKKFILPILLFLMFIPFVVNAETCDTDKITIQNITIGSKSDNVEELDEATANGKSINLNLSMSEVGDNIEYKFVVKNDSNEDYELDKTSLNLNTDYINYSFETEDSSNIVKANSSKNVTLRVEYKTEVPDDKFENGTYNDNKTMMVHLSNGETINVPDTFKNPNTGVQSYILVFLIVLLVSGTLYVVLKKKKYTKFMIFIIGGTIIIPISVYASCKCEIKIESKVEIESQYDYFCYYNDGNGFTVAKQTHIYKKGMTWKEYIESNDPKLINKMNNYPLVNILFPGTDCVNNCRTGLDNLDINNNQIFVTDINSDYYQLPNPDLEIISSMKICYVYIPN